MRNFLFLVLVAVILLTALAIMFQSLPACSNQDSLLVQREYRVIIGQWAVQQEQPLFGDVNTSLCAVK